MIRTPDVLLKTRNLKCSSGRCTFRRLKRRSSQGRRFPACRTHHAVVHLLSDQPRGLPLAALRGRVPAASTRRIPV